MSEFQIPQLKEYYLQSQPKRLRIINWRIRYTYDLTHVQLSELKFIKVTTVTAVLETKKGTHKVEGRNTQKIYGMWRVTEPDGDVQYVKHSIFMASYVLVDKEQNLWRKKSCVYAGQFSVPAIVHTQDGWFHYPAGFVLVETVSEAEESEEAEEAKVIDRYAMSEPEFRERYVPLVG